MITRVGEGFSPERMGRYFTQYLFTEFPAARHVRDVAPWIGLISAGIARIKDEWWINRTRQLHFKAHNRRYKVKYEHQVQPSLTRGIRIIEIGASLGSPEIIELAAITSLEGAERFYAKPQQSLVITPGQHVWGRWRDGEDYVGHLMRRRQDGGCDVRWLDSQETEAATHVRRASPSDVLAALKEIDAPAPRRNA